MEKYLILVSIFFTLNSFGFGSICGVYDVKNAHPDDLIVEIIPKCMVKGDTLYIDGSIDEFLIDELNVYPLNPIRKISLNSKGGKLEAAIELAEIINDNQIETHVRKNAVCKSACTLLFQAGFKRTAHPTALFMYHSARYLPFSKTKIQQIKECSLEKSQACIDENRQKSKELKKSTDLLFSLYEYYGIASSFYDLYKSLPDDPKWFNSGNYLKTIDWEMHAPETIQYNIVQELIL